MAILEIAQIGDPILRQRAVEVSPEDISSAATQSFIDDLIDTMRSANGAGLAAIQVSRAIRICVVEVRAPNPRYPYKPSIPLTIMINPEIMPVSTETFSNYEGCLSVPDMRGLVERYAEVRLRYLDRDGQRQDAIIRGVCAGTFQHECDHLDGKLFVDLVEDFGSLTTWSNFERYHQAKFFEDAEKIVSRFGS